MPSWSTATQGPIQRNFVLNVLDGAFFAFGMSLLSRSTVLPVLVKRIGGGNVAVGLIPVLWFIGFNLPQVLAVARAERAPLKKRLLLKTALAQRVPWLLLAVLTFFVVEHVSEVAGLLLFFGAFVLAALGGSINMPVWFDLVAKVTPVRLRGRLFALRTVLGAALGILGGWIVEMVLTGLNYPDSFAVLIGLGFSMMMISYVFLALLHEGTDGRVDGQPCLDGLLRRMPSILRHQRNFRNFLIGQILLVVATVVEAFFVLDAIQRYALPDAYAGRFVVVMMVSMMIGSLVFGHLADRLGHRLNLVIASAAMLAACVIALAAPTVGVYYFAFAGVALSLGLQNISRLMIVAEMCDDRDRPMYVALTNLVTTPFLLLGLLAGWAADQFGYSAVFAVAATIALAAVAWLALMVKEPRSAAQPSLGFRKP